VVVIEIGWEGRMRRAVYAPAELIATAAAWLVRLAAMVLLFGEKSAPYRRHGPAQQ
jgi:hypothetical protein